MVIFGVSDPRSLRARGETLTASLSSDDKRRPQRWQGFFAVPPATLARPGEGHLPGLATTSSEGV